MQPGRAAVRSRDHLDVDAAVGAADALPDSLAAVDGVVSVVRKGKGPLDNGEVALWLTPAVEPVPAPTGKRAVKV